jgi:hypothetical protein
MPRRKPKTYLVSHPEEYERALRFFLDYALYWKEHELANLLYAHIRNVAKQVDILSGHTAILDTITSLGFYLDTQGWASYQALKTTSRYSYEQLCIFA